MAYIMLPHYADLALDWMGYVEMLFNLDISVHRGCGLLGFVAKVKGALLLKASSDDEICFPETEKLFLSVCVCPIITHGWRRSVNYTCPVK